MEVYETSCQSRFNAQYWMLGASALGRPRGMEWGGSREVTERRNCALGWAPSGNDVDSGLRLEAETPDPYHPSGSSQCTSPKHPVLCIEPGLATRFLYDIISQEAPGQHPPRAPHPRSGPHVVRCLPRVPTLILTLVWPAGASYQPGGCGKKAEWCA